MRLITEGRLFCKGDLECRQLQTCRLEGVDGSAETRELLRRRVPHGDERVSEENLHWD